MGDEDIKNPLAYTVCQSTASLRSVAADIYDLRQEFSHHVEAVNGLASLNLTTEELLMSIDILNQTVVKLKKELLTNNNVYIWWTVASFVCQFIVLVTVPLVMMCYFKSRIHPKVEIQDQPSDTVVKTPIGSTISDESPTYENIDTFPQRPLWSTV